jgi:predicted nucleic acid-binding protein
VTSPKLYVDSNVFFYAKIQDKVFGESCSRVLTRIATKEIDASTSALVALEVANALGKYGLSKDVADEVRAMFSLGIDVYPVEPSDVRDAAEIYSETKISPYNCAHAAIMRRIGLSTIVSADREFEKVSWLKRVDPKSAKGMGGGDLLPSD